MGWSAGPIAEGGCALLTRGRAEGHEGLPGRGHGASRLQQDGPRVAVSTEEAAQPREQAVEEDQTGVDHAGGDRLPGAHPGVQQAAPAQQQVRGKSVLILLRAWKQSISSVLLESE